jgi:hypothetical protein
VATIAGLVTPRVAPATVGMVTAGIATLSVVLRRDLTVGLVVPHSIGRRGPRTAALAFGVVIGSGLARQHRGYWTAALFGAALIHAAIPAMLAYAFVRAAVPLAVLGCRDGDCVQSRLHAVLGSHSVQREALMLGCVLALSLVLIVGGFAGWRLLSY